MVERPVHIYRARRVIAMTPEEPEAFAVLGEHVVATGSIADLTARFPDAEQTDFGDAVVAPGFNDAHLHLSTAAENTLNVDVSAAAVGSLSEIKAKIAEEAARTAPGEWIKAIGYDDAKMAEGRVLERWDLDEVAPEHPVLVVHVAGHWGVVNSRALARGGLDDASVPPPGGDLGRDATGRLNGILYEQALSAFTYPSLASGQAIIPPMSMDDRLRGLRRAVEMFHAAGITSVGDALVGAEDLRLFQEARRRGELTLRVNMMIAYEYFDAIQRLGLLTGFGDHWLRFGAVKVFVDGAIGGRTCLLEEPFEGTDYHGIQVTATEDLRDIVRAVHEAGHRLAVHANGDRAIALLLDQIEAANDALPRPDAHHRIEHCTVINDDILRRMERLGAMAVPFATYVHYHGSNLLEWYGPRRVARMFAHRSFLDAGIPVAGSSDYPCGPFEPLLAMQSCVTRRGFDGSSLGANQRITPYEALSLYTTNAALASDEQDVKGRLAPGYLADFVVLGDDPLTADPQTLAAIPVLATYVGGARVWSAE